MRIIQLSPTDFIKFKTLANHFHLIFVYKVLHGMIHVEANALALDELGY